MWYDLLVKGYYEGAVRPRGWVIRYLRCTTALACTLVACVVLASPDPVAAITPSITEFLIPTANSEPVGITPGPDGNLWFTEVAGNIGRIPTSATPSSPQIVEFPIPTPHGGPVGIAQGSDGNLWFTEILDRIGRIPPDASPGSGAQIGEFPLNSTNEDAHWITQGPDGNLWFTETGHSQIARISPTAMPGTSGQSQEFALPLSSDPAGITPGPDGDLWFTEGAGKIGRIPASATASTQIVEFAIPTPSSDPQGITQGPDGNLWFTERGANQIARIPTTATPSSPHIVEFPLPTANASPTGIAQGPDGHLWFTEAGANRIGRIPVNATSGNPQIEEFPVAAGSLLGSQFSNSITLGPDGNMWFVETGTNHIGRITTPPTATTGGASAIGPTSAVVTGTTNGHAQPTSFHIEFGPIGGAMTMTSEQSTGPGGAADTPLSFSLTGLTPRTAYEYRVVATNPTDTTAGDVLTLTTPPLPIPLNTSPPVISGVTTQRQSIATSNGSWANSPTSYAYQWQDCDRRGKNCSDIRRANSNIYVLTASDVGHRVRSVVTAGNAGGSAQAASAHSAIVAAPPPRGVPTTMAWNFEGFRSYTIVQSLVAQKVLAGSLVKVSCQGVGCPYASHTVTAVARHHGCRQKRCNVKHPRPLNIDLARQFRGSHLAVGSRLAVRIIKAGWIGRVYRFTMRKARQPELKIDCLAPNSTRPGIGC